MSKSPNRFLKFRSKSGRKKYFSKGLLSKSFYAIGLDDINAYDLATKVEHKIGESKSTLSRSDIFDITLNELEKYNPHYARRYIALEQKKLYKPIIILLAGVPGIGKSTLASHLSRRLEITNIIGSDMIREILRQSISDKLAPELYGSSYEAYKYVKPEINPTLDKSIIGFEEQSRLIIVGVEAVIQSALYSRENTIIEGVHLAPNLLKPTILNNPHVFFFLLHLDDEEEHLTRFRSRGLKVVERDAERYINAFEEIRTIQQYLVEEAKKVKVPIIETNDKEKAIQSLMSSIWEKIFALIEENKEKEE
ncbi:MAG: AAA family ATPase [Candidatus Heimdallarchaeaceae archaeon]